MKTAPEVFEIHEKFLPDYKFQEADWSKREGEKPYYLEQKVSARRIFSELSRKWKEETGAESSLTKITANINYLRIISLGNMAVPLILKKLQLDEPAPWFVALRAITGELNIGRRYSGNFKKIADAWLDWGRENGYI